MPAETRDRRVYPFPETMVTAPSSHLTALVRQLIDDPSTSTAIRNECHRLLIAVEGNHQMLVEELLEHLMHLLAAAKVKTPQ
jgi:hypothetical protein